MAGAQQCLLQLHRCLQPGDAAGSALHGYSLLRSLVETCVASADSAEQGAARPGPGGAERGRGGLVGRDTRTGPVLLRGGSVRAAPHLLSPVIPREGGSPAPNTGAKHSGAGPSVLSSPRLASLGPEQRQAPGPVGLVTITHALLCIFWRHVSVCPRRQVPLLPQGMGRVMCLRPST